MLVQRVQAVDFVFLIAGAQFGAAAETIHEFTFLIGFMIARQGSAKLVRINFAFRSRQSRAMTAITAIPRAFSSKFLF